MESETSPSDTGSESKLMSVSSEELNLLVYRYLTEGGETYKTLPGLRSGAVCCVVCFCLHNGDFAVPHLGCLVEPHFNLLTHQFCARAHHIVVFIDLKTFRLRSCSFYICSRKSTGKK